MTTFKVYRHPTRGYEAVKVGWSWPAFFFGCVWLLIKQLPRLALIWALAVVILGLVSRVTEAANSDPVAQALMRVLVGAAYFVLGLIAGDKGNSWRIADLTKNGYEFAGEVPAGLASEAIAKVKKVGS